jgi:hypothetical protein
MNTVVRSVYKDNDVISFNFPSNIKISALFLHKTCAYLFTFIVCYDHEVDAAAE